MTSPSNSSCKRVDQPGVPEHEEFEIHDLFGRLWDVPRSGSKSQSEHNVDRAENAFGFRSVEMYPGHIDDPSS